MKKSYYRIPNIHDVNSRGIPRGVVIADASQSFDGVFVGFSICNPTDQFTKKLGTTIATNRLTQDPVFLPIEQLTSATPPADSPFAMKRFRQMWDFVRYVAYDELQYRRRRNSNKPASSGAD